MYLTFVWSPRARGGRTGSTGSSPPFGLVPARGVDFRRAPAFPDHHRLIPALAESSPEAWLVGDVATWRGVEFRMQPHGVTLGW